MKDENKNVDPALGMASLADETNQNTDSGRVDLKQDGNLANREPVEHEPPGDHPRFKEVYGKMKTFERSLVDKDTQITALQQHNATLAKSIEDIDSRVSETLRPDPADDPEGYEKWLTDKIMKSVGTVTPVAPVSVATPNTPSGGSASNQKLVIQEHAMAALHEDFYEVLEKVGTAMKSNEFLREEIMTHPNPPKKLYEYHQRLLRQKEGNDDRGRVEAGGYDGAALSRNGNKLTSEQKSMAANLGLSDAVYKKQLDFMNKRG